MNRSLPTECETDVTIAKHLITLLHEIQFYAEISRNVYKFPTRDIETACVWYDIEEEQVKIAWNPEFFSTLTPQETVGVIVHEFDHFINEHITTRAKDFEDDHDCANIAMDLAINSLIIDYKNVALPKCGLLPGKEVTWPGADPKFSALIKSLPTKKAADYYFAKLKSKLPPGMSGKSPQPGGKPDDEPHPGESGGSGDGDPSDKGAGEKGTDGDKPGTGGGKGRPDKNGKPTGGGTIDDHSVWQKVDGDVKQRIEAKINSIIEKAVKHADSTANGWGNMPADVIDNIRRKISKQVNWQQVLRQFIGALLVGGRKSSRRHINRKQPYDYPGVKRGRTVKLLVAVDESGSVDQKMLELFFGELYSLNRLIEIDVLPFDCVADEKKIVPLRKGCNIELKRTKQGGTCFDAPTDIFDNPKNRGRWDALLIVTDGQAPKPKSCRKRRAWVVPEGCKLHFETDETTIIIKKEMKLS